MLSSFAQFFRQFRVLAWKNALLKLRSPITLIMELALPTLIIIAVGGIRSVLKPTTVEKKIPFTFNYVVPFAYQYPLTSYSQSSNQKSWGNQNLVYRCPTSDDPGSGTSYESDSSKIDCQRMKIAVAPEYATGQDASGTAADDFVSFMNDIVNNLSGADQPVGDWLDSNDTVVRFDSESSFVSYIKDPRYSQDVTIPPYSSLVVFKSGYPNWEYSVRMNKTFYSYNYEKDQVDTTSIPIDIGTKVPSADGYALNYLYLYYYTLTDKINSFIATSTCKKSGGCSSNTIDVQMVGIVDFPHDEVIVSGFWGAVGFVFPLLMILVLLYPLANVVSVLVKEKEAKLRESMSMMAMRQDALWLSWVFNFLCLFLPLSIILSFAGGFLFSYSSKVVIFFYFIVFFISTTSYCIMMSTFFTKSRTACIISCLVFFGGYFIYIGMATSTGTLKRSSIAAACLHPATAFTYGTLAFTEYEDANVGVNFYTWNKTQNKSDWTFQDCLNMMLIDALWMAILTWYFNKVWPSEFGTQKPWYFICLPAYWKSCFDSLFLGKTTGVIYRRVGSSHNLEGDGIEMVSAKCPVEAVPEQLANQVENKNCVEIKDLYKEFKTNTGTKVAVDGLNLTLYNGQINVLLGHNGAGKTTAIAMLTGLIPSDGGTALIEGLDINNDMDEIRKNLGVCPQHDILFADLTVEEHLIMFASFKGMSRAELKQEVEQMIKIVGLTEKRHIRSKFLSGGQKRKLSIGIAFIGGSRIVFLDEPTSGMDPYSRRFTWNLIRQNRDKRVIVLTTHFMDEADLLGDRIAIMGDGKLRCCGSSLFLKKQFGVGYNMTIEKKDVHTFNSQSMIDLVQSRIKDATVLTDVGTELTFQLPFTSSQGFQPLFEHFDANESKLGIQSYGMSVTTLEEVFIKIAHGTNTIADQEKHHGTVATSSKDTSKAVADNWILPELEMGTSYLSPAGDHNFDKLADDDHFQYFFKHMHGLLYKRFVYFIRDSRAWIYQIVIPLLFLIIGCLIMKFTYPDSYQPPIELTTSMYNNDLLFNPGENVFPMIYNYDTSSTTTLKGGYCLPSVLEQYSFYDDTSRYDYQNVEYCAYYPSMFYGLTLDAAISANSEWYTYLQDDGTSDPLTQADIDNFKTPKDIMGSLSDNANFPLSTLNPDTTYNVIYSNAQVTNAQVTFNDMWTIANMSQAIFDAKTDYEASQIGAISFLQISSTGASPSVDYTSVKYLVHANYSAVFAGPLMQKIVIDGIVKDINPKASVKAYIYPLPLTGKENTIRSNWNSSLMIFFLLLAVPFLPAAFATYIVREKEAKSRHQQMVSGVSIYAYWLSTFIWDFASYQITLWLFVIIIAGFDDKGALTNRHRMGYFIALLQLYGSSVSGFTYLMTNLFSTPATAQIAILGVIFLTGFVLTIIGNVFRFLLYEEYNNYIKYVMATFPPFAFGNAINNIVSIEQFSIYELEGGKKYEVTDWDITGMNFTFLCAGTAVYLILTIAVDYWRLMPELCGGRQLPPPSASKDDDVLAEEHRVLSGEAENSNILIKDLKKMYPGGKYAVKGISLGIPQGECFGLLGINGAGKSSTLSMLSCEFKPSVGEAYLNGISLIREPNKCRRKIGFCPQFDALFELLSAREHLTLYARIKGIHEKDIPNVVNQKIDEMGLTEYADRAAGGYSGGNKRKLSVAIAMIGEPSIVFLDEPSTGMDPVARRFMWDVISNIVTKREKCSLILTTHSMEECDALCTRIGIMVGGVLRCLGSGQRLRSQYGRGYQLELGLVVPDAEIIHDQATKILTVLKKSLDAFDILLTRAELDSVFKAFGVYDKWNSRLTYTESGADLVASFETAKTVSLKHLASWMILEQSVDNIMIFLTQQYGDRNSPNGFYIRERQPAKLRIEVSSVTIDNQRRKLSTMFGAIESNKESLRIQEYSISQTSLEQIFNSFAAQQEEETGVAMTS